VLVERDQSAERRQPPKVVREARNLPTRLQMAEPRGDQQQVEIALSHHLVGDVDPVLLRVAGLGKHVLSRICHVSGEFNERAASPRHEPAGRIRKITRTTAVHRVRGPSLAPPQWRDAREVATRPKRLARSNDHNGCNGCTRRSLGFAGVRSPGPKPLQTEVLANSSERVRTPANFCHAEGRGFESHHPL
jgi:hypothetical protein